MVVFLHSLKLKSLHRFTSTATAVEEITAIQEGKLGKGLKQFLSDEIVNKGKGKEQLLVADPKLGMQTCPCAPTLYLTFFAGHSITKKLGIKVLAGSVEDAYTEMFRGIREQLGALLDGLEPKDLATMSLGLSHSLSRCVRM